MIDHDINATKNQSTQFIGNDMKINAAAIVEKMKCYAASQKYDRAGKKVR